MRQSFNSQEFIYDLGEDLIDSFSRGGKAKTPGLVGGARESLVRRKLQSILPARVGVATGCIIDSYGHTSNQADVILYEKDLCPVFSINEDSAATYIPCESAIAIGEIKSVLGTKELLDSVNKIASAKSLQRFANDATCFRHYGSVLVTQGSNEQSFDPVNKPLDQMFGFVLCQSFALTTDTLLKNFKEACSKYSFDECPNMIVSLANGVIVFTKNGEIHESRIGANCIWSGKCIEGEMAFLISKLYRWINNGRTTDVLPYHRYIFKNESESFGTGKYLPLD
jgi:hypothetical protein